MWTVHTSMRMEPKPQKKYSDAIRTQTESIACNDMTAVSVYKVLQKRGYRVPDDIQIIGFDGVKFGRFFDTGADDSRTADQRDGQMCGADDFRYCEGTSKG